MRLLTRAFCHAVREKLSTINHFLRINLSTKYKPDSHNSGNLCEKMKLGWWLIILELPQTLEGSVCSTNLKIRNSVICKMQCSVLYQVNNIKQEHIRHQRYITEKWQKSSLWGKKLGNSSRWLKSCKTHEHEGARKHASWHDFPPHAGIL